MDNTREKLIELLSYFADGYSVENRHIGDGTRVCEITDHLIANGVTVQMWISVTERLPEKTGIYLTSNQKKEYGFHFFQTGKSMWPAIWDEDGVTHWMPLPQPPKGD